MSANAIPLLATLTQLWNETEEQVRQFPKRDTQLLGRTILDDFDACTLHVLRALQDGTNRCRWLVEASAHYDRAKLKLRIAVKRELISERWYAAHLDTLAAIGKQLGGWQRTPPPNAPDAMSHPIERCDTHHHERRGRTADGYSHSRSADRSGTGSAHRRSS